MEQKINKVAGADKVMLLRQHEIGEAGGRKLIGVAEVCQDSKVHMIWKERRRMLQ